ncbi:DUF6702 family protein [uncultured Fibrella sp.]|uniref:DUF6702 family protein n=1 Tax=uncultured Fibrella sp. TaxID=1284596 RepID=UPI0035CA9EA4
MRLKKLEYPVNQCRMGNQRIRHSVFLPLLLLLVMAVTLVAFRWHDFHTSLTQMQFEAKSQTVEISIRMFTDDLETALTHENGGKLVQFGGPAKLDQLLERYVRKHFVVADAQRKPKPYTYVGYEQESDAHWVYIEMPAGGPDPFKNIVIKQDILMDVFSDQVNLINIQYQQQKKTVVFRNNQPVQAVSL